MSKTASSNASGVVPVTFEIALVRGLASLPRLDVLLHIVHVTSSPVLIISKHKRGLWIGRPEQ